MKAKPRTSPYEARVENAREIARDRVHAVGKMALCSDSQVLAVVPFDSFVPEEDGPRKNEAKHRASEAMAKAVCEHCLVREECLREYGLRLIVDADGREVLRNGVYGGKNTQERALKLMRENALRVMRPLR